jgi:hypothetical protein
MKLNGVIKIEDNFDPINPSPSSGRKLIPGSSTKEKRVQPAKTTKTHPNIFIPSKPV